MQWTKVTDNIFEDGKHLVTSRAKEDSLEKISFYMKNTAESFKIALQREKFVYENHTYEIRIKDKNPNKNSFIHYFY